MKQKTIEFNEGTVESFYFFRPDTDRKHLFAVPISRREDFKRIHKVAYAGGKEICFANGCNRWVKSSEAIKEVEVFEDFKTALYTNMGQNAELVMFLE